MKEIWKDIEGYEGLYQVSNLGRVKNIPISGKGIGRGRFRIEKILNGDISKEGKIRYTLSKSGKQKRIMGHIIVAIAFPEICGEWFEGCQVHHKDQNPSNNRADNLICLSADEHLQIHIAMGKYDGKNNPFYGKHHSEKTLIINRRKHRKPIIQLDLDGNEIMGWLSCTDCERQTGMEKSSINRCCLGKQQSAYGYKWRYAS